MTSPIKVYSEIGELKEVVVKRPGKELGNIKPKDIKHYLLSSYIDWKLAAKEHDAFTNILRKHHVKVHYLEDLVAQTYQAVTQKDRELFINKFIDEANVTGKVKKVMFSYLRKLPALKLIANMIEGISSEQLGLSKEHEVFLTEPLVNTYFTRDPFACFANGVTIHTMKYEIRKRETLFGWFLFNYHPKYKHTPKFINRNSKYRMEGGDVFIYTNDTLVIGVSDRTDIHAILTIAKALQKDRGNTFKQIVAINVPHEFELMHLDTWLTMLDHNKFLYSTNMMKSIKFWKIALNTKVIKAEQYKNVTLEQLLESIIHEKPILIPVADNYSKIEVDVETTFDGTNFLVIKPGVVVGYSRNVHTIEALKKAGIKVYAFDGDQLSLGMGSARCMSMPFVRKPITSSY